MLAREDLSRWGGKEQNHVIQKYDLSGKLLILNVQIHKLLDILKSNFLKNCRKILFFSIKLYFVFKIVLTYREKKNFQISMISYIRTIIIQNRKNNSDLENYRKG